MGGPPKAFADARRSLASLLEQNGLAPGSRLIVAVSGGSDSMALAHAALFVGKRSGYPVTTVTVDHGIRPGSRGEAERVAHTMLEWGASEARVTSINVAAIAGAGPEGAARSGRYSAIAREVAGAGGPAPQFADAPGASHAPRAAVLLGHTLDDQAETVLLGLGRGSGARSLAGMAPAGPLPEHPEVLALRPLLAIRRADLRQALRREGISWVDDPTNELGGPWRSADGSALTRAAIRHSALPALVEALGPGTVEALARTASLLRQDADCLDSLAAQELGKYEENCAFDSADSRPVSIPWLLSLERALRSRVLRALAQRAGARELSARHSAALEKLITGPGGYHVADLPGVRAVRNGPRLSFERIG